MGKWVAVTGLLAVMLLALAGCKKPAPGQETFALLQAGGMGLGLSFDMDPGAVHAKLGAPSASTERQGGAAVVDYYLPPGATDTDRAAPQLELTFLGGKLVRIYNRFHPEDPAAALPPHFIEPLPAVKLGARKSELAGALGAPTHASPAADEWRYNHRDGRSITILAQYVEIADVETELCCALTVIMGTALPEERGEEQQKTDWRELGKGITEGSGK